MVFFREDAVSVLVDLGKTNEWLDHFYLVLKVVNPYFLLADHTLKLAYSSLKGLSAGKTLLQLSQTLDYHRCLILSFLEFLKELLHLLFSFLSDRDCSCFSLLYFFIRPSYFSLHPFN